LVTTAYAQHTPHEAERAKKHEAKIKANSTKTAAKPSQYLEEKTKYTEARQSQLLQTQKGKAIEAQNQLKQAKIAQIEADKNAIKQAKKGATLEIQVDIERIKTLKPEDKQKYLTNLIDNNAGLTDEQKLAIKMELVRLEGKDVNVLKKDQEPTKEQATKIILPNLTQKDAKKVHYSEIQNPDNPQDPKGLTPEQLREYHIQKKKEYLLKQNQGKQE
jgi:hypothetical protein